LSWRERLHGAYDAWFSLKPKSYPLDELRSRPVAQVVAQVRSIHSELRAVLSTSPVKSVEFKYEDICREPKRFIDGVQQKLQQFGSRLQPRTTDLLPIKVSEAVSLPETFRAELEQLCRAVP
jgi:hypothetical protein